MDPNYQRPAAPTPPQNNPYDFILSAENAKKSKVSVNHSSLRGRLLVLLGGLTGLILIVILFSSLVLGSKVGNVEKLISLAAEQQEIIRVSELGLKGTVDPGVRALAVTVKLSVSSQQKELSTYLTNKKQKLTPAILDAKKDTQVDNELATAAKSNRFEEEFQSSIVGSLNSYQQSLGKAYDSVRDARVKTLLNKSYSSTEILLEE